jgi:hypothetical protein
MGLDQVVNTWVFGDVPDPNDHNSSIFLKTAKVNSIYYFFTKCMSNSIFAKQVIKHG